MEMGLMAVMGANFEETLAMDTTASLMEDLRVPLEQSPRDEVGLDERLWKMLPDVILFDMILPRLPLAAQCRFRCVCREWRRVLPLLSYLKQTTPPYTIMSTSRPGSARFFCHSEEKWLSLPSIGYPAWEVSSKRELLDVDAGLFCYLCTLNGRTWLSVCNPPTRFEQIVPAKFEFSPRDGLKLLVDSKNKTFKVVAPNGGLGLTSVYDSKMASWRVCCSYPWLWSGRKEFFVWKGVLYAYISKQKYFWDNFVLAFNMKLGQWIMVHAQFPDEDSSADPMKHFILSGKDHLMLVQLYGRERPYFSVWKLLDNCSNEPDFSLSTWEKVNIGSDRVTNCLAGKRLGHVCYGKEYICFMLCGNRIGKRHGWKTRKFVQKCLKYSFVTNSWSEMACPAGWKRVPRLYGWEPSLEFNADLNKSQEYPHSRIPYDQLG